MGSFNVLTSLLVGSLLVIAALFFSQRTRDPLPLTPPHLGKHEQHQEEHGAAPQPTVYANASLWPVSPPSPVPRRAPLPPAEDKPKGTGRDRPGWRVEGVPGLRPFRARHDLAIATVVHTPGYYKANPAHADTLVCVILAQAYGLFSLGNVSVPYDYLVIHDASVSPEQAAVFTANGLAPVLVPPLDFNPALGLSEYEKATFLKVWLLNLAYDRVVYLDLDFFPLGSMHWVIGSMPSWPEPLVGMHWDECEPVNTGFMVLRTKAEDFSLALGVLRNGTFNKRVGWNGVGSFPEMPSFPCKCQSGACACVDRNGAAGRCMNWDFFASNYDQGFLFYFYHLLMPGQLRVLGRSVKQPLRTNFPHIHLVGEKIWDPRHAKLVKRIHAYRKRSFFCLLRGSQATLRPPETCSSHLRSLCPREYCGESSSGCSGLVVGAAAAPKPKKPQQETPGPPPSENRQTQPETRAPPAVPQQRRKHKLEGSSLAVYEKILATAGFHPPNAIPTTWEPDSTERGGNGSNPRIYVTSLGGKGGFGNRVGYINTALHFALERGYGFVFPPLQPEAGEQSVHHSEASFPNFLADDSRWFSALRLSAKRGRLTLGACTSDRATRYRRNFHLAKMERQWRQTEVNGTVWTHCPHWSCVPFEFVPASSATKDESPEPALLVLPLRENGAWHWNYSLTLPTLRRQFFVRHPTPPDFVAQVRGEGKLLLAVHVRLGDVQRTGPWAFKYLRPAWYEAVLKVVFAAVDPACTAVYIATNGPKHADLAELLAHVASEYPKATVKVSGGNEGLHAVDDFHTLAMADIVVAARSDFSRLAAAFTSGVALAIEHFEHPLPLPNVVTLPTDFEPSALAPRFAAVARARYAGHKCLRGSD